MPKKPYSVVKTEAEWRALLSPEQFRVAREKGTERPFTGAFWNHFEPGTYACVACGQPLYASGTKFDAGCGWPSFTAPVEPGALETARDISHFMIRTELMCSGCGAHLGHVFDDGPGPTGERHCINSASLKFVPPAKPD